MKYTDRDISWLSFNERILQEAANLTVPLMERLKFLAIYSSNLEEFYRVRVASHRFEQKYKGDKKNKFGYRPSYILQQINLIVSKQQERLGKLFYSEIVPGMASEGIHLLFEELEPNDKTIAEEYFDHNLAAELPLQEITDNSKIELKNQAVYLYILWQDKEFLLHLDYKKHGRFITLARSDEETRIIQLDDIYKNNISKFLGTDAEVYAVKVSRDAELYINEEYENNIVKKIRKSLNKRETGMPSRLLFNENIPYKFINQLRIKLGLDITSLISGGRYHNFYDYFGFPEFKDKHHLYNKKIKVLPSPSLDNSNDWFETICGQDIFFSYPYQDFGYLPKLLAKAANDPKVEEINITLYRVNKTSEICVALEKAALNGKKVFVLAEVQARFDEESNIYWGERLEKAGAKVKYSVDGLKVHAKVFAIKRTENGETKTYAYLGTGNLNEKTSKLYADHGILTAKKEYTKDLDQVFRFLKDEKQKPTIEHLWVAPFVLRTNIYKNIDREIELAKSGKEASMLVKLNSFEDLEMIDKIREAADAGVKIEMVVRGICCYHPRNKKQAKNITVVSVIDKFLEHTRIYHFNNEGNPQSVLASADWMTRNLSKRIEVGFPVFDKAAQQLLVDQIRLQLSDNKNGRLIACENENQYVEGENKAGSQDRFYELVKSFIK